MTASSCCRRADRMVAGSSLFLGQKEAAALFSKPPHDRTGASIWLLYDGFFSFAVVRQLPTFLLFYNSILAEISQRICFSTK